MTTAPITDVIKLLLAGRSVIPSGGGAQKKHPIVPWTEYQKRLPTQQEILQWEENLKPSLWGIVTGPLSNVVVFDADKPETNTLFEQAGLEPHIKTRKGYHYYFLHWGGHIPTRAPIDSSLPGLDIRGDGGFANILGHNSEAEYLTLKFPDDNNLYAYDQLPSEVKKALEVTHKNQERLAAPLILKRIAEHTRDSTLTSLAGSLKQRGIPDQAIEITLLDVNRLLCDPPLPEAQVLKIASSIARYPVGKGSTPKLEELRVVCMADVKPVAVTWLWKPYIPRRKLSMMEGDPGEGKSWVALAITTATTLGSKLPNDDRNPQGSVLIASAEDGKDDTIRPRLDNMGADVKKVQFVDELFTLDREGCARLEKSIVHHQPILVVIDPLVAYLSGAVDTSRANQVREVTARLHQIAEKQDCAILAVRHLTKGGSTKSIYRGQGSIDFTASARSVLLVGQNPETRESGIVHIKSNLAPKGAAVGYRLENDYFTWSEHCELTAGQILASDETKDARQDAKDFLIETLTSGPVLAEEIEKQSRIRGISPATLNRAKKSLGIESCSEGIKGKRGAGKWYWKLAEKQEATQ